MQNETHLEYQLRKAKEKKNEIEQKLWKHEDMIEKYTEAYLRQEVIVHSLASKLSWSKRKDKLRKSPLGLFQNVKQKG